MSDEPTASYVVNFIHRFEFVYKFIWRLKDIVLFGQMNPWLGALVAFMTLYCLSLIYTLYRYFISRRSLKYKDKHVFITGGSTGLGLSLANKLYKRGAYVTIVARNEDRLKKVTSEILKAKGGKVQYFSADLSNPDTSVVEKLISDSESEFGPIDYLVCNAGYSAPETFLDSDLTNYEKQIDLNYYGYVKMSHPVAKAMAKRKSGTIVYVSSVLGCFTIPGYGGYCPSKAAVKALADSVSLELKAYNVNVHLFAPGTIDTPGYEEENKMKPDFVKKIEGNASFVTGDQGADILLRGMNRGDYLISTESLFELMFPSCIGVTSRDNLLFQIATAPLSVIVNSVMYYICHSECKKYKPHRD